MSPTQRYLVAIAVLPLIILGLRAISRGSASLFSSPGPTSVGSVTTTPLTTPVQCIVAPELGPHSETDMMAAGARLNDIASSLLAQRDLEIVSCGTLQSLWAGYGHVCSVEATPRSQSTAGDQTEGAARLSLILKYISPPVSANVSGEGHIRKVLSYQVEQYFYTHLAPQLPESVAVAECIASISDGQTTALVLKDLKSSNTDVKPSLAFPVSLEKRGELNAAQTYASLDWLAGFHGHFWGKTGEFPRDQLVRPPLEEADRQKHSPDGSLKAHFDVCGVWLNGGYTYLATRRTEYSSLVGDDDTEWSEVLCTPPAAGGPSLAERVANLLAPSSDARSPSPASKFETLIHGDVKSENMFASSTGAKVAFVDFQYVGLGLGVCDLAKLFTCSVPLSMLVGDADDTYPQEELDMQPGEKRLLRHYVSKLESVSSKEYPWDVFVEHWEAALVDWLRFQASWGFWGNTEWLEARVRHIVKHMDI